MRETAADIEFLQRLMDETLADISGHADHDEIHSIWTSLNDSDPYSWGNDIVLFRAEPAPMWAYAQRPNDFPE
jgi:hypothetical protein